MLKFFAVLLTARASYIIILTVQQIIFKSVSKFLDTSAKPFFLYRL